MKRNFEDNEVQLFIKPKYKFLYFLLSPSILKIIALTISFLSSCTIFLLVGKEPEFIPIAALSLFFYIIWLLFRIKAKKKELQNLKYEFYKTNFREHKNIIDIKYCNIGICRLKRSFLDRIFSFGKLVFYTKLWTSTIEIPFIENSEDVYRQITKLLDIDNKEDNYVREELKPTFLLKHQILKIFSFLLIISIYYASVISKSESEMCNFLFIMTIVGIIVLFHQKSVINKTSYKFLKTKVTHEKKFSIEELKYENIINITIERNIFQKKFGLANILLHTDIPRRVRGGIFPTSVGIKLCNIKDADEKIEMIRGIIEKETNT